MKKKIKAPLIDELTDSDRERRKQSEDAVQILTYNKWFEYERARDGIKEFDILYLQAVAGYNNPEISSEIRPLSIFLAGEINTGKTTLVTRYENVCEALAKEAGRSYTKYDILYYITPVRVTLKQMFAGILREKFGITIQGGALKNIHTNTLIDRLTTELHEKKVKLLIIDEIQLLIRASKEDKRDIFEGLKKLVNQNKTRLILVGTMKAFELFQKADWVEERFRAFILPSWDEGKEYLDLLKSLYEEYVEFVLDWNLLLPNGKVNTKLGHFLHVFSGGRLGALIQAIRFGIVSALLHGRTCPTEYDYKQTFYIKDGEIKKETQ